MDSLAWRSTQVAELVRADERISYLYVERCTLGRDENAITITNAGGIVHVPAAALGCLLLGPGTRVTHQVMLLLASSGAAAIWCGEAGARFYAGGVGLSRSSKVVEAQAALVSNQRSRLEVAREMYGRRFANENASTATMQQLRGREGARIKALYRVEADRTGVPWNGRLYRPDDFVTGDPVNQALSAAHYCLYGVVHAVIVALGASPALGFVHTGTAQAFVYDIADLYKAEISIPLAFEVARDPGPDISASVRKAFRQGLHTARLLPRITKDVLDLLIPGDQQDWTMGDVLMLWDGGSARVASGVSHAPEVPVEW
jgi:CRISPR-associated protein Cas1